MMLNSYASAAPGATCAHAKPNPLVGNCHRDRSSSYNFTKRARNGDAGKKQRKGELKKNGRNNVYVPAKLRHDLLGAIVQPNRPERLHHVQSGAEFAYGGHCWRF